MSVLHEVAVALTVLSLVACDQQAAKRSPSLVGATSLPTELELKNEMIILFRDVGENELLNYELHPNGQLIIARYRSTGLSRRKLAEERFKLADEQADSIRQLIWRLRPENDAPVSKTIPIGCPYVYDGGEDAGVGFSHHNQSSLEIFTLPFKRQCNSIAAREARQLFQDVLASFPPSNVDARLRRLD